MADVLVKASSLYNVTPIQNILRRGVTRNLDLSALADTPWDGEIVIADAMTGSKPSDSLLAADAAAAGAPAIARQANRARMIWGSHRRTDRQANGHEAVPVFNVDMSMEIELGLFCADGGSTLAAQMPAGTQMFVHKIADGSAIDRFVLAPSTLASQLTKVAWAVAEVIDTPAAENPTDDQKIKVRLYAQPRLVTITAA